MATYRNPADTAHPWRRANSDTLYSPAETSRVYADADVVTFFRLLKGTKIGLATIFTESLDSHATPTLTASLEFKPDGASAQALRTFTAAELKAGGLFFSNVLAGFGYVTQLDGVIQLRFTAAPATAAAGIVKVGVNVTAFNYVGQEPNG